MKQVTHPAWFHIIIASITIVYVFFGPRVYTRFFINHGKPIASNITLPSTTKVVQYSLDGVEATSSQGFYVLNGWAFQTEKLDEPVTDYERQVVFQTGSGNYIFQTDSVAQKYVQKFYSQYGLDVTMSGFSALIYRDTIKPGIYGIGLIFTNVKDHSTFFVSLDQCLIRTPNYLHLENLKSATCRLITHNEGRPVWKNSDIPDETISAQLYIETLTTLEDQDIYQLSGWGFPIDDRRMSSGSYERMIILSNEHDDFFFTARTVPRFDIQAAFTDLGMDLIESGFTSIISASVLSKGSYHLGLVFENNLDGNVYFINTTRCLTRTNDGLVLEVPGSQNCINPSP